ncbi:hypothetical protein C9F11_45695 (plasmid) [Streptomyces sp. YIM 121038]|nr:hypothetical protein C9F11_45695 [Streptomyces sp. YIM 121038]
MPQIIRDADSAVAHFDNGDDLFAPFPDHVLDVCAGSGDGEDVADLGGLGFGQLWVADLSAKDGRVPGCGLLEGEGDEKGVFALAEVFQAGLAGGLRVAEDTQEVIA